MIFSNEKISARRASEIFPVSRTTVLLKIARPPEGSVTARRSITGKQSVERLRFRLFKKASDPRRVYRDRVP